MLAPIAPRQTAAAMRKAFVLIGCLRSWFRVRPVLHSAEAVPKATNSFRQVGLPWRTLYRRLGDGSLLVCTQWLADCHGSRYNRSHKCHRSHFADCKTRQQGGAQTLRRSMRIVYETGSSLQSRHRCQILALEFFCFRLQKGTTPTTRARSKDRALRVSERR